MSRLTGGTLHPRKDEKTDYVCVERAESDLSPDRDWFVQVFEAVGMRR